MDEKELKELLEKQRKAWEDITAKLDELEKESKSNGTGVSALKAELEKRITDFGKLVDEARKAQGDAFTKRVDDLELKMKAGSISGMQRAKSAGQICAESDVFKNYQGGPTSQVMVKSFGRKDLTSDGASAGDLIVPFRVPGIIQPVPNQQLRIRDLLGMTPISSPLLVYARQIPPFGGSGASSGELAGDAAVVEEGHAKPKTDLKFEECQATAVTIAVWLAATRQILADAPVLRSFIDGQLLYSVLLEEEAQILYGGGAPGLDGITLAAGVFTPAAGETRIDSLRRLIAQVLAARFPATGFVLNPADWTEIELTKDGNQRYIIGDPNQLMGSRIWGLPVVQSESLLVDNALCGAFGMGATLYDREEASIRVSEHHEDYFTHNMVAILAEERIMLPIFRPLAFAYGPLVASS